MEWFFDIRDKVAGSIMSHSGVERDDANSLAENILFVLNDAGGLNVPYNFDVKGTDQDQ